MKFGNLSTIQTQQIQLQEDIDFVKSYVFDYNRFIIFYTEATTKAEIQAVAAQFKKIRENFFEISHSNSISPVHIGTLPDSVKSMENSQYFQKIRKLVKLLELGI